MSEQKDNFGAVASRVIEPGGGQTLSNGPVSIEYKLEETHGAGMSLVEYTAAPNFVAPQAMHWHTAEHACFYIIEGQLAFEFAQGRRQLGAGAFVHLPPGAPFFWSNPTDEPARFLAMWSPAGFENFFREVVDGVSRSGEDLSPEVMQKVIPPLWERYDIRGHSDES